MTEKERQEAIDNLLENQNRGKLAPAKRLKISPQEMPQQKPQERIHNVNEVALGYTETEARMEALRCLGCKNAPCVSGCPVRIRIRDFIAAIA